MKFIRGNAKLDKLEKVVGGPVYSFSLLAGHSCPYAKDCESRAIKINGKTRIQDGPHTKFRCFSASEEALFPQLYEHRNNNLNDVLISKNLVYDLSNAIPKDAKAIRIHVSGDFINQKYFDSWCEVTRNHPNIIFYAYTKSLPFWISAKQRNIIPTNFVLTASRGGYRDDLIRKHRLRQAVVIADFKTCETITRSNNHDIVPCGRYKGWLIDHDDSIACLTDKSFALLIHNIQPAGSEASKAKEVLKGISSYVRSKF